jgi:hypothetical protein
MTEEDFFGGSPGFLMGIGDSDLSLPLRRLLSPFS